MKFNRGGAIFLVVLIVFSGSFLYIKDKNLFADEEVYYLQIQRFMQGDFGVYGIITSIPGYHFLMAGLGNIFGVSSVSWIRAFNTIFGIGSIFIFFLLARKIWGTETSFLKTLQYAFFPILFPFFFLIYTDVLSLFIVLLMLYFVFKKRYFIGGVFGVLSFFVRQTNVIWIAFMIAFIYYSRERTIRIKIKAIGRVIRDCWVFVFGLVISAIFFIWNKGFALGDKAMHGGGVYFGNVFFILFLFFFLFLPSNIANLFDILRFIKRNKWSLFLILGIFFIYMEFFIVNHPYNFIASDYFLRNWILQYFGFGLLLKIVLFIPIIYSIFSLFVIKLKKKEHYLLYFFSLIFLLPMWLIEQRYYLISFSLFIFFKREDNKLISWASVVLYVVLSAWIFYEIGRNAFFL